MGVVLKLSEIAAVAFMLLSGVIIGVLNPWTINIQPASTASSPASYSHVSLSFAGWVSDFSRNDSLAVGDRLVYNILYGYAGRKVMWTYPYLYAANALTSRDFESMRDYLVENQQTDRSQTYITVHSYMLDSVSNFGVEPTELVLGSPLNITQFGKFDACPTLQRIYSSGTFAFFLLSNDRP
jgi:hypothetical protein